MVPRYKKFFQIILGVLILSILAFLCLQLFPKNYELIPEEDPFQFEDYNSYCDDGNSSSLDTYDSIVCFGRNNIFFIETSEANVLNVRQACAAESAARHNPSYSVRILMTSTSPLNMDSPLMKILPGISNVQIYRIDIREVAYGSPFEQWYDSGKWQTSTHKVHHLSDALRLLLLWRYGGIYLDMDVVVLRSMEHFKNMTVSDNGVNVCNGIMAFEKGHEFMRRCIEEFVAKYDPSAFADNGPVLINRNIKEYCHIQNIREVTPAHCNIEILPMVAAFPISYEKWEDYFQPQSIDRLGSTFDSSYLIHVWNALSSKGVLKFGNNSLYELAMKENCPMVYEYGRSIGNA